MIACGRIARSAAVGHLALIAPVMVAGCGSSASQSGDAGSASPLKASALSVGDSSACAVVDDGGVVCWGTNVNDLLGKGPNSPFSTTVPTRVAGIGERVTSLAMGARLRLRGDGQWTRLVLGHELLRLEHGSPQLLLDGRRWRAVRAGRAQHRRDTCADHGALGSTPPPSPWARASPVRCSREGPWSAGAPATSVRPAINDMSNLVPEPVSGLQHATAVSAGSVSACAITAGGGVVCWGANDWGQLGNGSTANSVRRRAGQRLDDRRDLPVRGVGSRPVPSLQTAPSSAGVRDTITQGSFRRAGEHVGSGAGRRSRARDEGRLVGRTVRGGSACAVTQGGGVVCWGGGAQGQLGNGSTANSATPVPVVGLTSGVASVSVGCGFACARTQAGRVECWGAILGRTDHDSGWRGELPRLHRQHALLGQAVAGRGFLSRVSTRGVGTSRTRGTPEGPACARRPAARWSGGTAKLSPRQGRGGGASWRTR